MAKKPKSIDDPHNSFEDSGAGIGQMADGTFDVYPLADLDKRTMERDSQDEATAYAVEQSEEGFPEQDEDFADLVDEADLEDGEAE